MPIVYSVDDKITPEEFIGVLQRSGLAERRPVDQPEAIQKMLDNANLIVSARDNGILIGIARSLTDFAFICYLSDLAVDKSYQSKGIGRQLMSLTKNKANCRSILLSAPASMDYYQHIGIQHLDNAFDFTKISAPTP